MAIRRGTATPTKVYRGTAVVQRIYRGAVQVWQAAPYPASGAWGPTAITNTQTTYASHTFVEAGSFTVTHTAYGSNTDLRVRINWSGGFKVSTSADGTSSTISTTRTFAIGDVVDFAAFHTSGSGTVNGTWTITKN